MSTCRLLVAISFLACVQAQPSASSTTPKERLNETWWAARHEQILARIHSNPNNIGLLLVGDSITQNYEKSDPPNEDFEPIWRRFYATRSALNLGFSGDRTEQVLWRLDHGEVDGIHPKAVVLLIGTNNTAAGNTAGETEHGIDAVVDKLQQKLPQAEIVLLGILPSDEPKAAVDREVNRCLARRYESRAKVTFLDIGPAFFRDGKLDTSIFYDSRLPTPRKALHPDTTGQLKMAEAIEPTLTRLLQDSGRQYLASLTEVNNAVIPVPRLEMDSYDWYQRHQDELAAQREVNPQIVLIGDSITHFWAGIPKAHIVNGPSAWHEAFGDLPVLNLGFGWDRTQNVLWRLSHGEFEGLHPKVVVLNIGTNNLSGTVNARASTPAEIVQGILSILEVVQSRSPESRIIVMGIFPRGFAPGTVIRESIAQVNRLLAQSLGGRPGTTFLDIGAAFLAPDGTLPKALMNDGTHPTDEGYKIWAKALLEAGATR